MAMALDGVKRAIAANRIDEVISAMRQTKPDEFQAVIEACGAYYDHELMVAQSIQDIVAYCRIRRSRKRIPAHGTFTYTLD